MSASSNVARLMYNALASCASRSRNMVLPMPSPYVDLALTAVTGFFVELTSRKWYTIMRIIAADPRKMARVYRSLSEIMLAVRFVGATVTGVSREGGLNA